LSRFQTRRGTNEPFPIAEHGRNSRILRRNGRRQTFVPPKARRESHARSPSRLAIGASCLFQVAGHPPRFGTRRSPRRSATSRRSARLAAKKRPKRRPLVSDLSRGGNSPPHRRTTSSSDHPLATSGSSRTSTCRWLSSTENPATETEKISASSRSRLSIHAFRSLKPSPSKKARRTQRVTQWYQRVTAGSTRCTRAIVIAGSPGAIQATDQSGTGRVNYAMPVLAIAIYVRLPPAGRENLAKAAGRARMVDTGEHNDT